MGFAVRAFKHGHAATPHPGAGGSADGSSDAAEVRGGLHEHDWQESCACPDALGALCRGCSPRRILGRAKAEDVQDSTTTPRVRILVLAKVLPGIWSKS